MEEVFPTFLYDASGAVHGQFVGGYFQSGTMVDGKFVEDGKMFQKQWLGNWGPMGDRVYQQDGTTRLANEVETRYGHMTQAELEEDMETSRRLDRLNPNRHQPPPETPEDFAEGVSSGAVPQATLTPAQVLAGADVALATGIGLSIAHSIANQDTGRGPSPDPSPDPAPPPSAGPSPGVDGGAVMPPPPHQVEDGGVGGPKVMMPILDTEWYRRYRLRGGKHHQLHGYVITGFV